MSSSSEEGCVLGAEFDPAGGKPASGRLAGPRSLWVPRRGLELGSRLSTSGFESELEQLQAEGSVLCGCEGRPGSPVDVQEDVLEQVAEEATTAMLQQPTDREDLDACRNRSPESCGTDVSTILAELESDPRRRGVRARGWMRSSTPAPAVVAPRHSRGPDGGRHLRSRNRAAKGRPRGAVDAQTLSAESLGLPTSSSGSDSTDGIDVAQLMQGSSSRKGGLARVRSPRANPRRSGGRSKESPVNVARPLLSAVGSAAAGWEPAPSRKMPSEAWGKAEGRSGRPATAAAASAGGGGGGGLSMATSWRKVPQEKTPRGGGSNVASGRRMPAWGPRAPAAVLEPVSLPTISSAPLLATSRKPKHPSGGTSRRYSSRRPREAQLAVQQDQQPTGSPAAQGEPLDTCPCSHPEAEPASGRAVPFQPFVLRTQPLHRLTYRGQFSSASLNTGPSVVPRRQRLALDQGDAPARRAAPSGDQELVDRLTKLERRQPPRQRRQRQRQQELPPPPPAAVACPRCPVLQREVDELREKLAALQSLTDEF